MLDLHTENLQNKKNLLAFSAGIDSSALFFLLIAHGIKFDIAIVNYGIRVQSKEEVKHAQALAKKYKLFCHTIEAPRFDGHFEKQARDFRYEFFESLITIEGYDNLLTAHQLNDQLEWFLMRLSKGAGISELIGLESISKRDNYALLRPLLEYSKEELLDYLHTNDHPYFIDESNADEKYERNKFRKQYSDTLISDYKEGIKRSFDYLREDKTTLAQAFESLLHTQELRIIKLHNKNAKIRAVDSALKELGYLLSSAQRQEIGKETSLVIGGQWAIELQGDLLYIAPYITLDMPKAFKEACRLAKIPTKIRPYMFQKDIPLTY